MSRPWRISSTDADRQPTVSTSRTTDTPVAIVGGGISGLSAAYEFERRGVPYLLFEKADRLGGVIHTEFDNGFTIDAGPDSLLVQKPAAIQLCGELGLGDRLVPTGTPRTAYVLRDGQLFPLPEGSVLGIPLGSLATTRLLSATGKARMALEVTILARTADADESIGAFFRRRFGTEAVDYIAEPLLAGIHAGDVEKLSMRALFPKLVDVECRYRSVITGLRALRASAPPSKDGMFRSLPRGLGELSSRLVGALRGECLHTGRAVTRLSRGVSLTLTLAGGEAVTAQQLLLATPAPVTAQLASGLDTDLAALCAAIPYTSTATVVLSYPRDVVDRPLDGTGFVVPRVETSCSLMAGSWVSSKWPGRAPDGQVLLRGFLGGARNPNALTGTDDQLIDCVHDDFKRLLGIRAAPVLRKVYRWPRLNPQHEVGHLDRLVAIDDRLADLPGVYLTGAGFRGVGIPDCVANGRAVAARVADKVRTTS